MENNEAIEEQTVDVKHDQGSDAVVGQESVELDLSRYGNLEVHSGGNRPEFAKVTRMKVKAATLMTTRDRKFDKKNDGSEQAYYPVYLKVTYAHEGQEFFENYGGGKLYVSDKKAEARFWVGNKSALGELRAKLEEYFEFSGSLKELPGMILGKEVGVKTEVSSVSGVEYKKNIIQVFY